MDFPASLPCFLLADYSVEPRSPVLEKDWGMDVRRRQIYSDMYEGISAALMLSPDQWATFREFYNVTTEMGSIPFDAPVSINGSVQTKEVRFTGPPPAYKPLSPGLARATCRLIVEPV